MSSNIQTIKCEIQTIQKGHQPVVERTASRYRLCGVYSFFLQSENWKCAISLDTKH